MNNIELTKKVTEKLTEAYNLAKSTSAPLHRHPAIEAILGGDVKTYKYILITALAAKAADNRLNPLCLQAGKDKLKRVPGAYDARTICHTCLVKFEKDFLDNALGGSNEPFLNKPARFLTLAKSNATKGGKYKIALDAIVDLLSQVNSSKRAFELLTQAISYVLKVKIAQKSLPFRFSNSKSCEHLKVYDITTSLLKKNNGGEILTLVAASLYEIYLHEIYKEYRVDVHNVNQSGASSRQISDIDLYLGKELLLCNEIKDKAFTISDIKHAVTKTKDASCKKLNFIYGLHYAPDENEVSCYQKQELKNDFVLNVISIKDFLSIILSFTRNVNVTLFASSLVSVARKNNYSQSTQTYLKEVLSSLG